MTNTLEHVAVGNILDYYSKHTQIQISKKNTYLVHLFRKDASWLERQSRVQLQCIVRAKIIKHISIKIKTVSLKRLNSLH